MRSLLFRLDAERAHHGSMGLFQTLNKIPGVSLLAEGWHRIADPRLRQQLWGLEFDNPVGLAAGFDKDALWYSALAALGFGHIEVGTLTAHAQPGNDRPRLFRLLQDKAILNRMGFNNGGSQAAAERFSRGLLTKPRRLVLGINIGKSKVTPLEDAVEDYLASFHRLAPFADYVTLNVSSPNTPGLRQLQDRQPLTELLRQLRSAADGLQQGDQRPLPLMLKIAPDLNFDQLDDIVRIVDEVGIDGVIATNTTVSREGLATPEAEVANLGAGGISGQPLTARSREVVRHLFGQLPRQVPVIGVGGVMSGEDAWQMICSGASLVQVYTGFVYGGPGFIKQLNRHLLKRLEQQGLSEIGTAVGSGV